jgi:YD repeat-containing protein
VLTYDPNAWLSQLVQVQQFGLGDTGNTTPYPVVHSFGYTQTVGSTMGQSLVAISDPLTGAAVGAGKALLLDINGDGLPDVIDASAPGQHRIWLSQIASDGTHHLIGPTDSAVGNSTNFPIGTLSVTPLDVNGDGYTDLINNANAKVLMNDGSGDWARIADFLPGGLDVTQTGTLRFFDYDGDKRIDVLEQTADTSITSVYRNNGDGTFAKIGVQQLGKVFTPLTQMADINGDGLLDVVVIDTTGGGSITYRINLGWGNWSQDGWITVPFTGTAADLNNLLIEDINGDSLRDMLIVQQTSVTYMLNRNGSSFDLPHTITSAVGGSTLPERGNGATVVTADMNGNGTQDVVWIDSSGKVTYLDLFATRPNLLTHIENGIGRVTDISYTSTVMQMARAREAGSPWKFRVPFAMTVVDKVDEWDRLTNLHEVNSYRYNDGYYDGTERQYRGHAHVTETMMGDASQEDGLVTSDFNVGDQDVYLHGRLLFESITSGTRLLSETAHEWDRCAVDLEVPNPSPAYPIVHTCETKVVTNIWEGGKSPVMTEVDTTYDGFGNVTKVANLGVISGCNATCTRPQDAFGEACGAGCLGDESYEEIQYVPRAKTNGAWIVHAPYREIRYGVAGGAQSETLTYYDTVAGMPYQGRSGELTQGLVTRVTEAVGGNAAPINMSRVLYDANGMVTSTLDPNGDPANTSSHLRNYSYDADGVRVTQVDVVMSDHKLERRVRYDERFNRPISSTSWISVGATTSGENASTYVYDSFGRLTEIHEPDPATALPAAMPTKWFTYDLGSKASKITSYSSLNGESSSCVDGRGRSYQSRTRTAQGNYLVTGFTIFNTRGETVQSYQPYSSDSGDCDVAPPMGTLATNFRYDAAHRPIETDLPDDAIYQTASKLTTTYLPLETQEFDALDNDMTSPFFNTPTIRRHDGLGRVTALGRTLTAGSPATFTIVTYDDLGHAQGYVDAAGNRKTQTYDLAGRLLMVQDPNAGPSTFTYDAAGNLLSKTDARNAVVRLSYDDMNRPLSRWDDADHDGTIVTAIYDGDPACPMCSNTAGRAAGFTWPGGKDSSGFDVRGRPIYGARTIDGTLFEMQNAFDDRDRLIAVTYPDGRSLMRTYDDAGRLLTIGGVVTGVTYDDRGLPSDAAYANNTHEARSYDNLMRLVEQTLTAPAGVAQSLKYSLDRVGNMTTIDDQTPNTTASLAANFQYDAWYRTTEVKRPDETLDYVFDAIDNIVSVSSTVSGNNLGKYTYDPMHPNGVTQAGGMSLGYDVAGNVTTRGKAKLTWDAFGRLKAVE